MSCGAKGTTRWSYTGNQTGYLNHTGLYNFVSGGPDGSGLSASTLVPIYTPPPTSRAVWEAAGAVFNQAILDASFPFIELRWVMDIHLGDQVFRVSDRNVYVEDENGVPRFYEARVLKAPTINVTTGEWLNPSFEISDVNVEINNRDGYFNAWLPQGESAIQWIGARVEIRLGIGEKASNYLLLFTGFVSPKQGVTTTETTVKLKIYDKFDDDQVPVPSVFFNTIDYPDLQETAAGKALALIYGDWSMEVGDYGEVPAYCINAAESNPDVYTFKISQNSLTTIGDVYLHRGDRTAASVDGPILLNSSVLAKRPGSGEFDIPTDVNALDDYSFVIPSAAAGPSSGLNLVTADGSKNFLLLGVKAGDEIIKRTATDPISGIVTSVASNALVTSGGIVFNEKDEYVVRTKNYTYIKGDRFTLKCTGKSLNVMNITRLASAALIDSIPVGFTIDNDGNFWFADNSAQKIYQVTQRNVILQTYDYSILNIGVLGAAPVTNISGLSIQTDNTLWFFDQSSSAFYRYIIDADKLGLYFTSTQVSGLGHAIPSAVGLTIDTGNLITVCENSTGTFFVINPFTPVQPTVAFSFNRSAFDALATEVYDLEADSNQGNLCVVDQQTNKFYRINPTNGSLINSYVMASTLSPEATFVTGVATYNDGTLFFLNRSDLSIYNYNELATSKDNPGFMARDILQTLAGKVSTDFDLNWNQTCREDLDAYKSRIYLADKTTAVTFVSKMLQQFNTVLYARSGKYALFHMTFANFRDDAPMIREADIKDASFQALKEYNQYFNVASCLYKKQPFSGDTTPSDNYTSPAAVLAAGGEIFKKLTFDNIYRRTDVDRLVPLFIRLAAAEPEFVNMETVFRLFFAQLCDFYRISFDEAPDPITGIKRGGRRFNEVPAFVRMIQYDLDTMLIKFKFWSLGSTQFGNYVPSGHIVGGENDKVVLTTLGTQGYVAPMGTITAVGSNYVDLADFNGVSAQSRTAPVCGKAWDAPYVVAIVNATTFATVAYRQIASVSGARLTFTEALPMGITVSTLNAAGFTTSGHFLRYAEYNSVSQVQKDNFTYFCPPSIGYPTSVAQETEEQRSGRHALPDGRGPYLLFPKDYVPS